MINFSKMRFLVVDDFSEFRSSIRGILGLLAVQHIDMAANGEAVLELCRRNRYDVILHDYNLGEGVSGQQVLERLHAENLLSPHCIFIMVTAENTQAMVLAAIECEPDDYLSKPFSKVALQTRLERLVRRKRVLAPVLTALEQGDCEQVLHACQAIEDKDPRHAVLCKRYKADALYELGRFGQLEQLLEQQARSRPAAWNLQMLARLWLQQEKSTQLNALLDAAMRQFPLMPELHDIRAELSARNNDLPAVVQSLQQAVSLSPNTVRRQIALSRQAWLNDQADVAMYALRQVWEHGRHSVAFDPELLWQLVSMLLRSGSGRRVDDTADWLKLLEREAIRSPLLQPLTALLHLLQRQNKGLSLDAAQLQDATERLSQQLPACSAVTLLQLGDCLQQLDHLPLARQCWRLCGERYSAIAGVPEQLATRLPDYDRAKMAQAIEQGRAAVAAYLCEDMPRAAELFKQALAQAPALVELNMNAARFYAAAAAAGDQQARTQLQQCLQRIGQLSALEPQAREFARMINPLEARPW